MNKLSKYVYIFFFVIFAFVAYLVGYQGSKSINSYFEGSKTSLVYAGYFPEEELHIDSSQMMRVRTDAEHDIVIVWNQGNQSLYKFNRLGEYQKTVTQKGSGPGEVGYVTGISLDSGKVVLNDQSKFMFHIYDYEGSFIESILYEDTILLDITYKKPFIYALNAFSVSGDYQNQEPSVLVYHIETGELVDAIYLDLNHIDPSNRMMSLVADDNHLYMFPKSSPEVYVYNPYSNTIVENTKLSGYDYDSLKHTLSELYEIDTPNLISDVHLGSGTFSVALNGKKRKIIKMNKKFKNSGFIELQESMSFREQEYVRSIALTEEHIYVLNGQGDGIVHFFNYNK